MSAPQAKQSVDNTDLVGVAIENSGRVSFHNGDGFFDGIFDLYTWENKDVKVFSYSPNGYRIIFKGVIKDKSYTSTSVAFNLKDFLYQLRDSAVSELYTDADGRISEDIIGQNKRLVYGKTKGLHIQSVDQILEGKQEAGTISGAKDGTTVTGIGTQFLADLSPSDTIKADVNGISWEFFVSSVESDTSLTVSEALGLTFSSADYIVKPERPYREYNRIYYIANHKLREPTTTVSSVEQLNRIVLTSAADMFEDDYLLIGAETARIRLISTNTVTLWQNLNSSPAIGTTVTRRPIEALYFHRKKIPVTLYAIDNQNTYCKLTVSEDAEISHTPTLVLGGSVTFTNLSRIVTVTSGNFEKIRSRDWVQSGDINHQSWYEVLQVINESTLHLRTNYTGSTIAGTAKIKNVEYLGDSDIVTIDCYGKEKNLAWVKTGADVVKDLLEMAEIPDVNSSSFSSANADCPYVIDLKLPLTKTGSMSKYRDIISLVNQSVLANLAVNQDFELVYNTLNSSIPDDIAKITQDDYLSYTVSSDTEILKTIIARFGFFDADYLSHNSGSSATQITSEFVTNIVQGTATKEYNLHLANRTEAEEITERLLLFSSLTNSIIKIRGKLNFSIFDINEKIVLDLRRIYTRFGAIFTKRIGVLSSITKNGEDTTVEFTDLGNSLSRSARIAPDTAPDFSIANEEEKLYYGYIVDDETELPDNDEDNWGNYIIS
jgi:hypothetical protein